MASWSTAHHRWADTPWAGVNCWFMVITGYWLNGLCFMGRRVQVGVLGVDKNEREGPEMQPKNGATCTNGACTEQRGNAEPLTWSRTSQKNWTRIRTSLQIYSQVRRSIERWTHSVLGTNFKAWEWIWMSLFSSLIRSGSEWGKTKTWANLKPERMGENDGTVSGLYCKFSLISIKPGSLYREKRRSERPRKYRCMREITSECERTNTRQN